MSAFGQKQTFCDAGRMSALPPKADMCSATRNVRFVPIADIREMTCVKHYLATGVCIEMILLSAAAHASATAEFGDVEPGGVAKPLSLM